MSKIITHRRVEIDGRHLDIFDGAVDFSERERAYSVIRNSTYLIGNEDADAIETSQHKYLCAYYNDADLANVGIIDAIRETPVWGLVGHLPLVRVHVNLSTQTDCHWAHDHRGQIGLIYYVNKHWKHDWAGETMFFSDDLSEVAFASVYKPGRIIVFDGEIPHSVRPQSSSAPSYRFTLSLFFQKP